MFEEAIRYPAKGDDAVKTILIGGVLGILGFLVIPAIVVQGYILREMRAVVRGEPEPPIFDEWMDLFVDGVMFVVVSLVYALVPIVLGAALLLTTGTSSGTVGPRTTVPFAILGVGAVVLIGLAIYYFVPAALVNLAVQDDLGAAFDFDAILELVKTGTYLTAWLVGLGIGILTAAIVMLLGATGVGVIVVPFVSFYANVAVFYLFARAYRDVFGSPTVPAPS